MFDRAEFELEGQYHANEGTLFSYTYRLMRVVKLCIWPPLAMMGNKLLPVAEEGEGVENERGYEPKTR